MMEKYYYYVDTWYGGPYFAKNRVKEIHEGFTLIQSNEDFEGHFPKKVLFESKELAEEYCKWLNADESRTPEYWIPCSYVDESIPLPDCDMCNNSRVVGDRAGYSGWDVYPCGCLEEQYKYSPAQIEDMEYYYRGYLGEPFEYFKRQTRIIFQDKNTCNEYCKYLNKLKEHEYV